MGVELLWLDLNISEQFGVQAQPKQKASGILSHLAPLRYMLQIQLLNMLIFLSQFLLKYSFLKQLLSGQEVRFPV